MANVTFLQEEDFDEQAQARKLLQPGMILYGYCGGRFGRDGYGDKIILKVRKDSVRVTNERGVEQDSFLIDDWVELIKQSNQSLAEKLEYKKNV
jgi:hypothetical protein